MNDSIEFCHGPSRARRESPARKSDLRHALFVAYHFPPESGSSGVLRTLKYVKYLETLGWRSTVITLERDAYDVIDEKLEQELPESARVVRTKHVDSKRHLAVFGKYPSIVAIPDRWIGWYPWATSAARAVIATDRPEVMHSTSPHATAHIIAWRLAKRARIPWVVDFRDPWYEEPAEPDTPLLVHWASRWLERKVVESANQIVTSTSGLRDEMIKRYPWISPSKFKFILNGFDEADFRFLEGTRGHQKQLSIAHVGQLNNAFRDPKPLLRALEELVSSKMIGRKKMELRFIGSDQYVSSTDLRGWVREIGLKTIVKFEPRLPYHQALRAMSTSNVALLLQASPDTRELVPAKLFEYLRMGLPILAMVGSGAAAGNIVKELNAGWVVDPEDAQAVQDTLAEIYNAWKTGSLQQHAADIDVVKEKYSRERLTGQLAATFEKVASRVESIPSQEHSNS